MAETIREVHEEHDALLQSASGLNRAIAESGEPGRLGQPRTIVEINGNGKRTFQRVLLEQRHLVHLNLGKETNGFDKVIAVEDIAAVDVEAALSGVPVHSAIFAHQENYVSAARLQEMILDVLAKIEKGTVYCIGEVLWQRKYAGVRDAIATIKDIFGSQVQLQRELLLPVISTSFGRKIVGLTALDQMQAIKEEILGGGKNAEIERYPLHRPIEQPYVPGDALAHKGGVAIPKMADEVITICKITEEEAKARRKRERELKERKKRR